MRGLYGVAIETLQSADAVLDEVERGVVMMERFIDAVLRNRTTPTSERPVVTEPQTQRLVTEGRVPTETRTQQTYTTGQTTPGLEVATSSKEAIRNRLAALRAELNSIIGEIPVRENALAALERERGSLLGEIQSLRGRVQELQSRLNNLGSYVSNEAALRDRIASLRSEVEGLRAQLANLQAIRNDLSMRLMQIPVRF
jgi:chromosome segregation ATPase